VQKETPHGSKNGKLPYSHAGLHACTDPNPESGGISKFDQDIAPAATAAAAPDLQVTGPTEDRTCVQCRGPVDGKERPVTIAGKTVQLHPECQRFYQPNYPDLPDFLRRPSPTNGQKLAVSMR
jgi:hypothetical protein